MQKYNERVRKTTLQIKMEIFFDRQKQQNIHKNVMLKQNLKSLSTTLQLILYYF